MLLLPFRRLLNLNYFSSKFFTNAAALPLPPEFNSLVQHHISSGSISQAIFLLQRHPPSQSGVFLWNSVIRHRLYLRFYLHSFNLYLQMLISDWKPDDYTFSFVLKACGELRSFSRGASLHCSLLNRGFNSNVFVCNSLISMYWRCGSIEHASQVFDEMIRNNVYDIVTWNSLINVHVRSNDSKKAIEAFITFSHCFHHLKPVAATLVNILPVCFFESARFRGKQVHGYAIRSGLVQNMFVVNSIIAMYSKCEFMEDAEKVFDHSNVRDVVSWNSMVTGYSQAGRLDDAAALIDRMMEDEVETDVFTWSSVISGYSQRGDGRRALDVFRRMCFYGSKPNSVTIISLLSGCASAGALPEGRGIHCFSIKHILGIDDNAHGDDTMVYNGLIDMYAKCEKMETAYTVFNMVPLSERNVVTWTTMIGGYAQHGEANDALQLFAQMPLVENALEPNAFTLSCVLIACARLAAFRPGRQVHGYALRNGHKLSTMFISNCLIDMYSKSGDVDAAGSVFDGMGRRNFVSWMSLITAYGVHGRGEEAIGVFERMTEAGFNPDGVTFVIILHACSHSGMVDEGIMFFRAMSVEFGVVKGVEHYVCMVDLLGRAGRLNEAMGIIQKMPMAQSPAIWISLLGACRVYVNVELAEFSLRKLEQMEATNDGIYTLISNIYASAGRWNDVARIRSLMKNTGIKKRPGCSWVHGKKKAVTFFVGDRSHPESPQIYTLLRELIKNIEGLGYVPVTGFALHDVDDEEKNNLLLEHSEKLALAYAILTSTSTAAPIHITKNLRVCGDCHSAITYISMIIENEIIIRDSSRFHHFKNGACSCRGYW